MDASQPEARSTWSKRRAFPGNGASPETVRCSICNFPAVDARQTPGAAFGLKPVVITGTIYSGVRSDASVLTFDKEVLVQQPAGTCPFCFGERWLDGRRGSGNRTP